MGNMLEQAVKEILNKTMATDFPQTRFPAALKAKISKKIPAGREHRLTVRMEGNDGETVERELICDWYEYSLRILSKDGEPDDAYPAIPGVLSTVQADVGSIVAVVLLYGELSPYILGEV